MTHRASFSVAVTGHRPNRLAIGEARAKARIADLLSALRRGARKRGLHPPDVTAISALAEGADRLFAEVALALHFRLDVILPFRSTEYEGTFSDNSDLDRYHALLARAEHVDELPGSRADSKAAYEAVGHATVDRADILLAVWDGKPAAGRGGTPEIIEHALTRGRPVIWIDAARERPSRLLRLPAAHGPRAIPLARLAARARPITRRQIATLAGATRLSSHDHRLPSGG